MWLARNASDRPAHLPACCASARSDGGGALRRKWMDAGYLPAGGEWADANTLHYEQDLAARCGAGHGAPTPCKLQLAPDLPSLRSV